jgi:ABC-type multidrug transport system ATPase subunit
MPAVSFSEISKSFGSVQALKNVSFSVPENTIFGVLGPNGAGKTTLFSVLAGFIKPDSGKVTLLGREDIEKVKGRIGILPQDAFFQSNIPILYQLIFFLRLMGWTKQAAESEVLRVLGLVGLDSILFREAATLSHGMYKRLALAQAFLGSPEIVILDEPTSGLDWKSAKRVRETIRSLTENTTVLVSSHNMHEMNELCDHIAVLREGTLETVGPVDSVTGSAVSMTVTLDRELTAEEIGSCTDTEGVYEFEKAGENMYRISFDVHVDISEINAAVKAVQKKLIDFGVMLKSVQEDNRLEELYLKVTEKPETEG